MTYYPDLSLYEYCEYFARTITYNVGWISSTEPFPATEASDLILDRLWRHCSVSVAGARGLHTCELCNDRESSVFIRDDKTLLLGAAEIRVMSPHGTIFAAPNLIYHYVADHHYAPPEAFLRALETAPCPPDQAYFDGLKTLDLAWRYTTSPPRDQKPFFIRRLED